MATRQQGWRTSTYSSNGDDCVEVTSTAVGVSIRHSKDRGGPTISFTGEQWHRWLAEVASGATESSNGAVHVTAEPDGWQVRSVETGQILHFTNREVHAFLRGVDDGEFDLRQGVLAPVS